MKTSLVVWTTVFVLVLCAPLSAEAPLRFARVGNIPAQHVGGEILKVVYGRLNIPIELVDMPATRSLLEASEGRLDGEVHRCASVQDQYPTLIKVQPAINHIEPSVFSKKYSFEVPGWDSIKDYNVGIVRGVGTSEDITRGMTHVLAVTTLEQLMVTLAADRIDVAVADAFSGLSIIGKLGLANEIRVLTPPLRTDYAYHFLHEKHRDLVPKVEAVLREMEVSGELQALRKELVEKHLADVSAATSHGN